MNKKQDITPTNKYGELHGLCIWYGDDGNVWTIQRYVNGILHGINEAYLAYSGNPWRKNYNSNNETLYCEYYLYTNRIQFEI